jgi:pectinesterase
MWRERAVIDKPFIHLIGEGRDESVIVFDRSAGNKGPDGKPLGTFGTATMVVTATDFCATKLTIANDFDYVAHMPSPVSDDKTGASGSQAVAFAIQGGADRSLLEDVHFVGYQDTLFTDSGRSLFRNCRVDGCVDFIFGQGRAVFERCDILSRVRPGQDLNGYIAAPDTDRRQPFGLVFIGCRLLKEKGMAPHTVALGRPWRHTQDFPDGRYGDPDNVGAAAYLHCWMDDHIVPEGWYPMGYNAKGGGRAMLQPEEARLYEFDSNGPGTGAASARRRQLIPQAARTYGTRNVLQGWPED